MPSQEPSAKPRRRSISSWPVDSNRDSNADRITTTVGGHLGTEKLRYQYGQRPQGTVPDNPLIVWDQEVGSSNLPAPTRYNSGVNWCPLFSTINQLLPQLLQQPGEIAPRYILGNRHRFATWSHRTLSILSPSSTT